MIDVILSFLNGILGFLNGILPDSPFTDIIEGNETMLNALGWLNWLVPINDLLAIFSVYLVALLAYQAASLALDGAIVAKDAVIGRK